MQQFNKIKHRVECRQLDIEASHQQRKPPAYLPSIDPNQAALIALPPPEYRPLIDPKQANRLLCRITATQSETISVNPPPIDTEDTHATNYQIEQHLHGTKQGPNAELVDSAPVTV
jgi:hypothetical protein